MGHPLGVGVAYQFTIKNKTQERGSRIGIPVRIQPRRSSLNLDEDSPGVSRSQRLFYVAECFQKYRVDVHGSHFKNCCHYLKVSKRFCGYFWLMRKPPGTIEYEWGLN